MFIVLISQRCLLSVNTIQAKSLLTNFSKKLNYFLSVSESAK